MMMMTCSMFTKMHRDCSSIYDGTMAIRLYDSKETTWRETL